MEQEIMESVATVESSGSVADTTENESAYLENGFIVDVSDAKKISDVIYQLSTILDIPDAQNKDICLRLGDIDLNSSQLSSIKALVETMSSKIAFVTTSSDVTEKSAQEIGMKVSKLENKVVTPNYEVNSESSAELERALDKIFGGVSNEAQKIKEKIEKLAKPIENAMKPVADDLKIASDIISQEGIAPELNDIGTDVDDFAKYEEFNRELEAANNVSAEEEKKLKAELQAKLQLTEKLPTLYIQRTLRSGQTLTADGNVVIVGDVNPGSEIKAVGDITVWGILGGIAHAGIEGNGFAKIRALKMNAIQIRIADIFARRPDGGNMPYIQKTDSFVPEEAGVEGNHIIIQKLITR